MRDLILQVLTELRSAWRFRWAGLAASWAVLLCGLAWIISQPNVYEANARIYVDTFSVLRPILENQIVPPDIATQLEYVREALLGRERLNRVALETGQFEHAGATTGAAREAVLNELRSELRLISSGSDDNSPDNLYSISYRHESRDTAVGVVAALLEALVDETLSANREGTDTAQRFLDERIGEYEERLQRAETALADFKRQNSSALPGVEGGYFARIQQETVELEEKRRQLRLARARRAELLEQLNGETSVMPIMSDIEVELPPNSIDARIRDYRLELDRLMLEYTENHPDVIAAREAGDRLEAQRADRLRALGIEDADQQLSTLRSNPVYQALQIAINEADVEIAEREADIVEHESALQELQALIDEVPRVEAELARLNRDYEVVYEQYQALVRSRETQDLSRKVSDMDQTQFRVINPPLADLEPVAPQRFTLLVMVFAASLVVGNGLCWLLSQLWPVFSDTQTLRKTCGLPVLGVVTNARQELDRSRKRTATASFAAATLVLIAVFLLCAYMALAGPGLAIMRRSVG